jgi:aspartyl-tRNA(Asn)/glutamyl-tRNA(Gln) amidotransferase subunit B
VDAGGRIRQETRSFDPDTGQTSTLRSKEEAHDYRYFPEPDLPALRIQSAFIADCRRSMPELPGAVRTRWHERGIAAGTAHTLSQHPGYVRFFETVCEAFPQPVKAANFVANDVLRGAHVHGLSATFSVTPSQVAELLKLVEGGEISGKQAKEVFAAIEGTDKRPQALVEERGMRVVSNQGELRALCEALIAKFPDQAASVRSGKKGVLGFFVGQAMKETRGSADPKLVSDLLESLLAIPS